MLEIEVQTKLYIKKYLELKYGNPVILTRNDLEGSFLYELLEDPRIDRDKQASIFPHTVNVQLPDRVLLRKGHYLTPTQSSNFNNWIANYIKEEAFKHIDLLLKHKPSMEIREAIYDYQLHYGLFDDYFAFDTIKKGYYRHRIRKGGQIRIRQSVS